jgi:apolipoprotein N-acyltransferase
MTQWLPWILSILSGVLLGLCYPRWGFGDLSWVALVPLTWAIWFSKPSARREWLRLSGLGYVCGLVFFAISANWLSTLTWAGTILLVLYFAFYFAAWAIFAGSLAGTPASEKSPWLGSLHNLRVCAIGAAGWVATEWLRGIIFPAFGWNGLGISQHANIPLIQIADITGVGGISFLVAMSNLMLAATIKRLILEVKSGARRPHYDFAITLALVALAWIYGVREVFTPVPDATEIRFAAVQANIPQEVRNNADEELAVLDIYKKQTLTAIAMKPDLILWPESSTPSPLLNNQLTWDMVRGLAVEHTGDFLIGTTYYGKEGDFNSIVLLTKQGSEAQIYNKMHLVPFGEYVPLRHEFPLMAKIVGELVPDDFDAGHDFKVLEMETKHIKIAPLVCFEDTLGDQARHIVQLGAQMFSVVTNDGWFLQSAGSLQHLHNALFRCVENKIPMIRAANTGVTCAINNHGVVTEILKNENGSTFTQGVLFGKIQVPTNPTLTFYSRYGEIFSILCLLISGIWTALKLIKFQKLKKSACSIPQETKACES